MMNLIDTLASLKINFKCEKPAAVQATSSALDNRHVAFTQRDHVDTLPLNVCALVYIVCCRSTQRVFFLEPELPQLVGIFTGWPAARRSNCSVLFAG